MTSYILWLTYLTRCCYNPKSGAECSAFPQPEDGRPDNPNGPLGTASVFVMFTGGPVKYTLTASYGEIWFPNTLAMDPRIEGIAWKGTHKRHSLWKGFTYTTCCISFSLYAPCSGLLKSGVMTEQPPYTISCRRVFFLLMPCAASGFALWAQSPGH